MTDAKTEIRTAVALKVLSATVAEEIAAGKDRLMEFSEATGAKSFVAELDGVEIGTVSRRKGRSGGITVDNETALISHLRGHNMHHVLREVVDPVWIDKHLETYADKWAEENGGELPPGLDYKAAGEDYIAVNPNKNAAPLVIEAMRRGEFPLLPASKTDES